MTPDRAAAGVRWLLDGSHWSGPDGIGRRLLEQAGVSALAVGICCLLAIPAALWLGHAGRGRRVGDASAVVPAFALLAVLRLVAGEVHVGGWTPPATLLTVVALVLLGTPPLLAAGCAGLRQVDSTVRDVARGLGMSDRQLLWRVELPLATPRLLAGLRRCSVRVVAAAGVAALVAGPGLGEIVVQGLRRGDYGQVLGGAVGIAVLALAVDLGLAGVVRVAARRGH